MRFTSAGIGSGVEKDIFRLVTDGFDKGLHMEKLHELLENCMNKELQQMVLSNSKNPGIGTKVKVRPVLLKGELCFQETLYRGTQVFHVNKSASDMVDEVCDLTEQVFRQVQITTLHRECTVLISKKGTVTIKSKRKESDTAGDLRNAETGNGRTNAEPLEHNRTKQYILPEGDPVDFLIGLGVQTPDGRIAKTRYDKFRQINRYLEFIEDILEQLPADRTIKIVDFGCGKSYLTFAMYYYLHKRQGRDIEVVGYDLKEDVIKKCNALAQQLDYKNLSFRQGDISDCDDKDDVDMVVSLHACDKATDYALEKAVKWGAKVIMAVPCCHHELNGQIKNDMLQPVLKYGVIKERMAALLTDALRANLLEEQGYSTQILEFIDMEHTPKNLMIRGVKREGIRPTKKTDKVMQLMEELQVKPTLRELI